MFVVCGEALFDVFVGEERADGSLLLDARAGGSPFNVAIGLARLGSPAGFLAGLSRDPLGERLAARLEAEGVDTRFLVRSDRLTTLSLVGKTAEGTPAYTFYGAEAADRCLTSADLPLFPRKVIGLHFGSYSIVAQPVADAFAKLAEREAGLRLISLDPNVRPTVEPDMKVWRRRVGALAEVATVIKASAEDLELLWPGKDHQAVATQWFEMGVALVVVTLGDRGAIAYSRGDLIQASLTGTKVIDTVGAGDSFQAALLNGLAAMQLTSKAKLAQIGRTELAALLDYASRAAAITCSRRGADLPRTAELGAAPARYP